MIIEYDETGKVIPSGDIGYHAERNQLEVETVPEGDFLFHISEKYTSMISINVWSMTGRYDTGMKSRMDS